MLNLHIERKKKELEKASRKRKGRRMQEALDRLYYGENAKEVKKNMEDFIREHEQVPEYQPLISEYRRLRGEIRQINLRITNRADKENPVETAKKMIPFARKEQELLLQIVNLRLEEIQSEEDALLKEELQHLEA